MKLFDVFVHGSILLIGTHQKKTRQVLPETKNGISVTYNVFLNLFYVIQYQEI